METKNSAKKTSLPQAAKKHKKAPESAYISASKNTADFPSSLFSAIPKLEQNHLPPEKYSLPKTHKPAKNWQGF